MGVFFVYILKLSVCLAVFYLFCRLLLSKETFRRFNRCNFVGRDTFIVCCSIDSLEYFDASAGDRGYC